MLRKTKIICTLGPAVKDIKTIKQLITAGMNIARLNFSHGDHAYHKEMADMVRRASQELSIPVALLLDTKGPEIRTGMTKNNSPITLESGKRIILTTEEIPGTEKILSISHKNLYAEVKPGNHIYIADGVVELEVKKIIGQEIHCLIKNGAEIGSRKNLNVTGIKSSLPAVTKQDVKDILFGIEHGFDFIAASFIRKPGDVKEIRAIADSTDYQIDIIAKIEDQEGLDNIDEIIRVSNGIMVARGDLGVQIPAEEIPLVQKRMVQKCNQVNKPVIIATQMLDSMIRNPLPTRAEVTDVANAILDGTDAIMLSGETATGRHPVKSVEMMHKIALEIENSPEYKKRSEVLFENQEKQNMASTIARASFLTARDIRAKAILTPSLRGNTPKLISRFRPYQPIIAVTPYEKVRKNLLLYWGVFSILGEITPDSDSMIQNAVNKAMKEGYIQNRDKIVIVAGIPVNSPIMLNTIRIHLISNVLGKGLRGYGKTVSGKIVKVNNLKEAKNKIKGTGNEILLARYVDESYYPVLKKVCGYILDEFSAMSWEEIYKVNPGLVALAGCRNAMANLKDNQWVTLDGEEKLIYE
jgi:pyruvate kinase